MIKRKKEKVKKSKRWWSEWTRGKTGDREWPGPMWDQCCIQCNDWLQ